MNGVFGVAAASLPREDNEFSFNTNSFGTTWQQDRDILTGQLQVAPAAEGNSWWEAIYLWSLDSW